MVYKLKQKYVKAKVSGFFGDFEERYRLAKVRLPLPKGRMPLIQAHSHSDTSDIIKLLKRRGLSARFYEKKGEFGILVPRKDFQKAIDIIRKDKTGYGLYDIKTIVRK
jgi:hypothetical protein